MKLKTKRKVMYGGVIVCAVGMLSAFAVPEKMVWLSAGAIALGAALVLGFAFWSSRHNCLEGEELSEKDMEMSYQSLGMASGMCLGAAVSFLFYDNLTVGMPVGMVIGFLIGSLIRKNDGRRGR